MGWVSRRLRPIVDPLLHLSDAGGQPRLMRGTLVDVAYPSRPSLEPLPQFAGTATSRPDPKSLKRLVDFVLEQYVVHDRSLREIAELTDRSFSAIRNILDRRGVPRRPAGASAEPQVSCDPVQGTRDSRPAARVTCSTSCGSTLALAR